MPEAFFAFTQGFLDPLALGDVVKEYGYFSVLRISLPYAFSQPIRLG